MLAELLKSHGNKIFIASYLLIANRPLIINHTLIAHRPLVANHSLKTNQPIVQLFTVFRFVFPLSQTIMIMTLFTI